MILDKKVSPSQRPLARILSPVQPAARSWYWRYAFAAGAVAVGWIGREALTPLVGETALPFIFFFPAIAASAWYGGLRPALFCVVASAITADWFFMDPVHEFSFGSLDIAAVSAFVFACLFIVGAVEAMHRASARMIHEMSNREIAEAEQTRSQHLLATTLTSIGDGVIVTDSRGVVTFLNSEAERLTGWNGADAAGKPLSVVFRILNEGTRQPAENPVTKALQTGITVGLANHTVLIAKDGSEIPIDDSAAPIRGTDGGPTFGVVLVFRDVREQRKDDNARARLAAIVEFSGDAIITKDLNAIVQTWNAGAQRLFGYTAEEMIGKSITLLLPPDRLDEESEILARLRRGEPYERIETIRVNKSGKLIPVSLSVSPLKDKNNRVIGASKIVHDISAVVAAREALAQERELLATTLTSIGDAVIVTDAASNVTFLNPEAERLTGWKRAEATGLHLAEIFRLVHEETRQTVENPVDKVLRLGNVVGLANHTILIGRDGTETPIDDSAAPIVHDGGTMYGAVLVFRDFTVRRQVEQKLRESEERFRLMSETLQEASRRKDEFLAILSHELRNPMSPIRMAIAMLRKLGPAEPELEKLRDTIDRQTIHLTRLLDDLLDVSRISSGKITIKKDRVDLRNAVSTAVEAARPQMEAHKHELAVRIPEEPIFVDGDLVRLSQVFANLLNNAAKFTKDGGQISLSLYQEGGSAVVQVIDPGIGIREDQMSRIFEMFAQLDQSLERSQGGLGVGLSLAKRFVELHGGHIDARSEGLGKGSVFTVYLPISIGPGSPQVDARSAVDSPMRKTRRRVLVADDNVDSAAMLTAVLHSAGHEVLTTHDGVATLEAAADFRPDIAILDIGMPRLNGYDVARQIRSRLGSEVVLIAVTGWGQAEDKRLAIDAGFNHHLTKPVELATLYKLLEQLS